MNSRAGIPAAMNSRAGRPTSPAVHSLHHIPHQLNNRPPFRAGGIPHPLNNRPPFRAGGIPRPLNNRPPFRAGGIPHPLDNRPPFRTGGISSYGATHLPPERPSPLSFAPAPLPHKSTVERRTVATKSNGRTNPHRQQGVGYATAKASLGKTEWRPRQPTPTAFSPHPGADRSPTPLPLTQSVAKVDVPKTNFTHGDSESSSRKTTQFGRLFQQSVDTMGTRQFSSTTQFTPSSEPSFSAPVLVFGSMEPSELSFVSHFENHAVGTEEGYRGEAEGEPETESEGEGEEEVGGVGETQLEGYCGEAEGEREGESETESDGEEEVGGAEAGGEREGESETETESGGEREGESEMESEAGGEREGETETQSEGEDKIGGAEAEGESEGESGTESEGEEKIGGAEAEGESEGEAETERKGEEEVGGVGETQLEEAWRGEAEGEREVESETESEGEAVGGVGETQLEGLDGGGGLVPGCIRGEGEEGKCEGGDGIARGEGKCAGVGGEREDPMLKEEGGGEVQGKETNEGSEEQEGEELEDGGGIQTTMGGRKYSFTIPFTTLVFGDMDPISLSLMSVSGGYKGSSGTGKNEAGYYGEADTEKEEIESEGEGEPEDVGEGVRGQGEGTGAGEGVGGGAEVEGEENEGKEGEGGKGTPGEGDEGSSGKRTVFGGSLFGHQPTSIVLVFGSMDPVSLSLVSGYKGSSGTEKVGAGYCGEADTQIVEEEEIESEGEGGRGRGEGTGAGGEERTCDDEEEDDVLEDAGEEGEEDGGGEGDDEEVDGVPEDAGEDGEGVGVGGESDEEEDEIPEDASEEGEGVGVGGESDDEEDDVPEEKSGGEGVGGVVEREGSAGEEGEGAEEEEEVVVPDDVGEEGKGVGGGGGGEGTGAQGEEEEKVVLDDVGEEGKGGGGGEGEGTGAGGEESAGAGVKEEKGGEADGVGEGGGAGVKEEEGGEAEGVGEVTRVGGDSESTGEGAEESSVYGHRTAFGGPLYGHQTSLVLISFGRCMGTQFGSKPPTITLEGFGQTVSSSNASQMVAVCQTAYALNIKEICEADSDGGAQVEHEERGEAQGEQEARDDPKETGGADEARGCVRGKEEGDLGDRAKTEGGTKVDTGCEVGGGGSEDQICKQGTCKGEREEDNKRSEEDREEEAEKKAKEGELTSRWLMEFEDTTKANTGGGGRGEAENEAATGRKGRRRGKTALARIFSKLKRWILCA